MLLNGPAGGVTSGYHLSLCAVASRIYSNVSLRRGQKLSFPGASKPFCHPVALAATGLQRSHDASGGWLVRFCVLPATDPPESKPLISTAQPFHPPGENAKAMASHALIVV